jgi:DNA-binding NtrC family response regulator
MSNSQMNTLLIVDDQRCVLDSLNLMLKHEGIHSVGVEGAAAALEALRRQDFDAALVDLNFSRGARSGLEGMALLDRLRLFAPDMPIVVMTGWGSVSLAVEAMRKGAADFIEKPWDDTKLLNVLRTQFEFGEGARQKRQSGADISPSKGEESNPIIAESPAMQRVERLVSRFASSNANVLLLGEIGTGKGMIARRLHDLSDRSEQTFLRVNMGCIAEDLFESEMFGRASGTYPGIDGERIGRFELAEGGTLFLDEICNIAVAHQPKLLRVLEEGGEFERVGSAQTRRTDVRLIAATNAKLESEVSAGRFRLDLLYRLNAMEITMPPLRQRKEDILPLARHYLERGAKRHGRCRLRLSPCAERALLSYQWPGNVLELGHMIERAALLAEHDELGSADLPFADETQRADDLTSMTLGEAESWLVQRSLKMHDGNLCRAAAALGVTRQALYRRIEKFGLRSTAEN